MMLKNAIIPCSLLVLLILFPTCSVKNNNERIILDSGWQYSLTGRKGDFSPVNLKQLNNLDMLVENGKGYIWLRNTFSIPDTLRSQDLACYLGKVDIANKTFLNEKYIGKGGQFPPYIFSAGRVSQFYPIPQDCLLYNDRNILVIKIWVDTIGQISDIPFIGTERDCAKFANQETFLNSKMNFGFAAIMIIIAVIYMLLYILNPVDKANWSYALLNFFSSLYLTTFYISEFNFIANSETSFLWYQKFFHGISPVLAGYFAISFIRDFLKVEEIKKHKVFRRVLIFVSSFLIIISWDLKSCFTFMGIAYILLGIQVLYAFRLLFDAFKSKNKYASQLLGGFSPVLLAVAFDFFMNTLLKIPNIPLFTTLGWQLVIVNFLVMLICRFTDIQKQVEYMNTNLEKIVKERTSELSKANTLLSETNVQLEYEKKRTDKELQLASLVQQKFYQQTAPAVDDWEISFIFRPLLGVSGDLYDFFLTDSKLDGIGLFDVSGHGIASGLVTMLSKNIIHREFYTKRNEELTTVMEKINDSIIDGKGSIENYMTGIITRIEGNTVYSVNAGHPEPILYRSHEKKASFIQGKDFHRCGVIGIADFPVRFETTSAALNSGDMILFYTDGVTESVCTKGEDFGKYRLLESFEKHADLQCDEIINSILTDVKVFKGNANLADDMTMIILKRK